MSHDEIPLAHVNDCDRPHDRPQFNVGEFYERKRKWSLETFGPAQTTAGVVAHMRSEVIELRTAIAKPGRRIGEIDAICEELSDICLLAIDMSWRAGGDAADFGEISGDRDHITPANAARYVDLHLTTIADGAMPPRAGAVVIWGIAFRALACNPEWIEKKFAALLTRTWPDWRTVPADQPIEHVREDSATRRGDDAIAEELVAPLLAERSAMAAAIAKLTAERDEAQERSGRAIIERDALLLEEKDWRADSERLRLERDDVRKVLAAQPHETVTMAAQRVVNLSVARSVDIDSMEKRLARSIRRDTGLLEALGVIGDLPLSAIVERAGQLHDDSVAYRSLRGRLVEVIDAPADFSDIDLLDLVADRINGPISDAEDDLLEQVRQLEDDVCALKAALHVATRAVQS